jgi:hypothetical protein
MREEKRIPDNISNTETDLTGDSPYNAALGGLLKTREGLVDSSIRKDKREGTGENRERRCVSRTTTKAQAYVSRQGSPRYKGKVRDLSSTGVFVATGPLPIRERHVVKLNLVLDLGSVVRLHNRPAIVVRRSREGVALKFF